MHTLRRTMLCMHDETPARTVADLNRLHNAVAVAREGSFAAAAKAIPLSQPALTRSIQSLERRYGIQLFDRRKSGSHLTAAGVQFIAAAEDILWSAKRADERLSDIARGENTTVRFGAGAMVNAVVLPAMLRDLTRLDVRFQIRSGASGALRSLLAQGDIDFFVGGMAGDPRSFTAAHGFHAEPIGAEARPIELFVRADHPIVGQRPRPEALRQFPVATASYTRERLGFEGFNSLGLRQPNVEHDDIHALAGLAASTDYILVANGIIQYLQPSYGLVMVSPKQPRGLQPWRLAVVSSAHAPLAGAAAHVAELLRSTILEMYEKGSRPPGAGDSGAQRSSD